MNEIVNDQPTNSILEVKLDYITKDIHEMKSDIKEMKGDYLSRREFEERSKATEEKGIVRIKESDEKRESGFIYLKEKVNFLTKLVNGIGTTVGLALMGALLKLLIK